MTATAELTWWPQSEKGSAIIKQTWDLCEDLWGKGVDVKVSLTPHEGGPRITIAFDHDVTEDGF